jgi:hypothetical protein
VAKNPLRHNNQQKAENSVLVFSAKFQLLSSCANSHKRQNRRFK